MYIASNRRLACEVKELVKTTLEAKGITIKKEGSIEAEEIDKKMLIDQHYYAIAVKATRRAAGVFVLEIFVLKIPGS